MLRIGLGLVTCLVVVGGCARPRALGMPSPPPSPARLAPEISFPLDLAPYAAMPCTLLKQGQPVLQDLDTGKNTGSTCTWQAKTPQQPEMTATVELKSGGLEAVYRERARLPYFDPTEIAGYPAVRWDTERSVPDQGRCTVSVGVNEDALLTITSRIADPKTLNYPVPCPDTDLFASAILTSIMKG
jgi:hypothetical protein